MKTVGTEPTEESKQWHVKCGTASQKKRPVISWKSDGDNVFRQSRNSACRWKPKEDNATAIQYPDILTSLRMTIKEKRG